MELFIVDGISCIKKEVQNIEVYHKLKENKIIGIPDVIKIDGNTVYYQYINGKTLRYFIDEYKVFDKSAIAHLIYSIAQCLKELKKIEVVHKDLKPENIVISTDNKVYVIDFDISRIEVCKESDTTLFGTRGYASPEHFGYSNTTFKSDMFSLGRIIEEIDKDGYYTHISSKCTQVDPNNRFSSYDELISKLDKLSIQKKDIVLKSVYLKLSFIIPYSVTYLLIFFIGISYDKMTNLERLSDIVIGLWATFILLDISDYIRINIFYRKQRKEILAIKKNVTLIVAITLFLLYTLPSILFK